MVMTLRGRLMLVLAYVLVLAIGSMLVPLVRSVRDRISAEVSQAAVSQAEVVAATAGDTSDPAALAVTAARQVRGRVLILDARGVVVADSSPGGVGADYSSRPEVRAALRGTTSQDERESSTLDEPILATAVPVLRDGRPDGAVRITQSVDAVDRAVGSATIGLVLVGAIVLALGLGAGALLAASIVRPLRRLAVAARRAGEGDLSARVAIEGSLEQREVGQAFNEMTARVQRMVDAQRDFVADASHQLRTPLTGLRLRLEEVAATGSREDLSAALDEVDRLSDVVSELLVLSEAGAARAPDAVCELLAGAARAVERHPAAHIELRGSPSLVRCTAGDLDRMLDAVLENAIDYGPAGQMVVVAVAPGQLTVTDEGPGLRAGEEETVFHRFHRGTVGRASRRRGTGLGLAIARELSARWNGTVTLANAPEGGAVATITFPVADGATTSEHPAEATTS
ncbi:HAMP domain-containing protein [Solirubrobacter sp. CPCC 204708]|uniref:histidine kinase n=1 Tax=Solirubrobacter deserti TaxID=2282478 RepID=A0ABT4RKZ4_9ACTN|nr:HAMP domain-containing sensor histidine kinase [Solirubrobacter deserti]MBE2316774.1 HAMP domain-containing protein [Solirubrobacter deserti]MDA0139011.1 HAMP domain-containing histidine kinase [Solirubrobacter deserti]